MTDRTRARFEELARRLDYRLARLELDLGHLSLRTAATGSGVDHRALLVGVIDARRRHRARLASALQRLAGGDYQRCERCGGEIALLRLKRLPFAGSCQACLGEEDVDFTRHLTEQHDSIEALVGALTALSACVLEECEAGQVDLAGSDALAELISDLDQELSEHFALEEAGSYLEELVRAAPRLEHAVDAIRAQHVELCKSAGELVTRAQEAGSEETLWRSIHAALGELAHAISRHEAAEHEVVRAAFTPEPA